LLEQIGLTSLIGCISVQGYGTPKLEHSKTEQTPKRLRPDQDNKPEQPRLLAYAKT